MKIVIDIPEEQYEIIKELVKKQNSICPEADSAEKIILNGTPLPKGHGRLVDEKEILRELGSYHIGGIDAIKNYHGENTWEDGLHTAWRVIDDAETIIPAESEEEE